MQASADPFTAIQEQINDRIRAKETEIQEILRQTRERYITELKANITYHEGLARSLTEVGEHNSALRHKILADIYKSMLERA